ncbi:hypothetical protein Mapa_004482 [Marchantia paleacea]|nr:hypothetical protein Mapa_004482 [Marchantia paleacea]
MGEPCARLVVQQPDCAGGTGVIYVKSRWFASHFCLSISDGLDAWTCQPSPEEVSRKAFSWDYTVTQYLDQAKEHLDHQNPDCTYSFTSVGDGGRKLSWTLEKDGVRLVAHWKAEKSLDPRETTCTILDCLMDGSSRLSEELQRKIRSFDNMRAEASRLTAQTQKFRDQKIQFEDDIYRKFVAVLNAKKAKLRELRAQALQMPSPSKKKDKDNEVVEETDSEDELDESDEEGEDNESSQKKRRLEAESIAAKVENAAAADSQATELYRDSPTGDDVSSIKREFTPAASVSNVDRNQEPEQQKHVTAEPAADVSPPKVGAEALTDATTLLGGSTYNSAPRRRRR